MESVRVKFVLLVWLVLASLTVSVRAASSTVPPYDSIQDYFISGDPVSWNAEDDAPKYFHSLAWPSDTVSFFSYLQEDNSILPPEVTIYNRTGDALATLKLQLVKSANFSGWEASFQIPYRGSTDGELILEFDKPPTQAGQQSKWAIYKSNLNSAPALSELITPPETIPSSTAESIHNTEQTSQIGTTPTGKRFESSEYRRIDWLPEQRKSELFSVPLPKGYVTVLNMKNTYQGVTNVFSSVQMDIYNDASATRESWIHYVKDYLRYKSGRAGAVIYWASNYTTAYVRIWKEDVDKESPLATEFSYYYVPYSDAGAGKDAPDSYSYAVPIREGNYENNILHKSDTDVYEIGLDAGDELNVSAHTQPLNTFDVDGAHLDYNLYDSSEKMVASNYQGFCFEGSLCRPLLYRSTKPQKTYLVFNNVHSFAGVGVYDFNITVIHSKDAAVKPSLLPAEEPGSSIISGVRVVNAPDVFCSCGLNQNESCVSDACCSDAQCGRGATCNLANHQCKHQSECKLIRETGLWTDKANVVFIGDGYSSDEALAGDVQSVVDWTGNSGYLGLFSEEPFRSNRAKFNIWAIRKDLGIDFGNTTQQETSRLLALTDAVGTYCGQADYLVVLAKRNWKALFSLNGLKALGFRSFAFGGYSKAYLSIPEGVPKGCGLLEQVGNACSGRLLSHEFGHAFGKLLDEYVEEGLGDRSGKPNCAPSTEQAARWWVNASQKQYIHGCSYVEKNIRSTQNSIMRNQDDPNARYGDVNSEAILEQLSHYN